MDELLTAEDVADYLRVAPNTVYRWCRDGKLTAIKLGKDWRITPQDLDQFLDSRRTGERVTSIDKIFSKNLRAPEHVLVMMTDPQGVYQLEADFFKIGHQQSRPLYKGCWWQHPDDVRREYEAAGLPVAHWESAGNLVIEDFRHLFRQRGPQAVYDAWGQQAQAYKGQVFWGAGAHLVNDWEGNYEGLLSFEEGLHQLLNKIQVVALCCCLVAPSETMATATLFNLAAHHTGSLFVVQDSAVLMRPVVVS